MTEVGPISHSLIHLPSSLAPLRPPGSRLASNLERIYSLLVFCLVFWVVCSFLTLTLLVGVTSFPEIRQDKHAICIVINHTIQEICSETVGKGFFRAYILDIFTHNASQGQTLYTAYPWYISEAAATTELSHLLPIGSNWSCIYDPKTLELRDLAYNSAEYFILTWAIVGVLFLICILSIICYCRKTGHVSPSPLPSSPLSMRRPSTYHVLRDEL